MASPAPLALSGSFGVRTRQNRPPSPAKRSIASGGVSRVCSEVTSTTHTEWETLLGNFALALYAGGVSRPERELLNAQYRYRTFDLAAALASVSTGGYSLQPTRIAFTDFVQSASLPAASMSYTLLSAGAELKTLNLSVSAPRGLALRSGAPIQLLVLRTR